jgi:hypothetical protein
VASNQGNTTATGVELAPDAGAPLPSCPRLSLPQHFTPSSKSAHVETCPPSILIALWRS